MRLLDKVVLITGAKGGLGVAVTRRFLAEGARVTGVSRSIVGDDFPHSCFHAIPSALNSAENARAIVEGTMARWGRLDAVVHLVGEFTAGPGIAETSDEDLERMLTTNFWSAFHLFRATLPLLRQAGQGRVLAIASKSAVVPPPGQAAYAAAKAALVSLVRSVAAEERDHAICANILLPGTLDTPANRAAMPAADFSRWTPPGEVASLLVHLASGEAAHVTGALIPLDLSAL